jgi:glucose/arabinose dehydrogenase
VEQPYGNHNGGMMAFGPDGMLYISFGDGGSAGDPQGNGQNKKTLLGKILRIDVEHQEGKLAYAIPKDNPFVSDPNARGEIWAYGLRNIWRFSFDRAGGTLWGGDVGQNAWEEIDVIKKGANYGWNVREGKHPYEGAKSNDGGPFEEPLWDYGRKEGQSITGGHVYRGKKWPALSGAYIYADFMSGKIWALRMNGDTVENNELLAKGATISSFGEDQNGELYFLSLYSGKIQTLQRK